MTVVENQWSERARIVANQLGLPPGSSLEEVLESLFQGILYIDPETGKQHSPEEIDQNFIRLTQIMIETHDHIMDADVPIAIRADMLEAWQRCADKFKHEMDAYAARR